MRGQLETALLLLQVCAWRPHALATAIDDVKEVVEEPLQRGVDKQAGGEDPWVVGRSADPLREQGADIRTPSRRAEQTLRIDNVTQLGPHCADVVPRMCRAIAARHLHQRVGLPAEVELRGRRPPWNAVAALLADGIDKVIQALHILPVAKVARLTPAHGVALLVARRVEAQILLAGCGGDVVDGGTVAEVAVRFWRLQTAGRTHPAGHHYLLAGHVHAQAPFVVVAWVRLRRTGRRLR